MIVAPTLKYHFYPAFLEYPGSTSLTLTTARDITAEVVRNLCVRTATVLRVEHGHLDPARRGLRRASRVRRRRSYARRTQPAPRSGRPASTEQQGGTHADEIETSMMLYIDPSSVDMSKAVKDYMPRLVLVC